MTLRNGSIFYHAIQRKRDIFLLIHTQWWSETVVLNLRYAKTSYINKNETQEPLEPWTSFDPRTHEDSSPNGGAGMPVTGSVISLTGQNHINSW
jgi:hypothetical protein